MGVHPRSPTRSKKQICSEKILIVTAKLLTGFDAPICYCMSLDKPIRDQALSQAMCRTNRLYSAGKQHGLIIDYLGVFENLAKALA